MDRRIWIVIAVLVLIGLGILVFSSMTGNVITGGAIFDKEKCVDNEVFRISDFGCDDEKEVLENGEG